MEIALGVIGLIITALTGIGGALWGAQVGAKMSADYARRLAQETERGQDQAAVFALHHKVSRIYGQATAIYRLIDTALKEARTEQVVWSLKVPQPGNALPNVNFTVEEHYRASKSGGKAIANSIMVLDEEHNALLDVHRNFFADREAVLDYVVSKEVGLRADEISSEAFRAYQDAFDRLDNTLEDIQGEADRIRRAAFDTIIECMKVRIGAFGEDVAYSIESPDGKFTYIGKPPPEGIDSFVPRAPEEPAAAHARGEP